MPTVKLTIQPDREVEVDAREFENLKQQGLLVDEEEEDEADKDSEQDKRLAALEARRAKSAAQKTEGS